MQMIIQKIKDFSLQDFLKKNLGGFTLIELLVVIAIIGLLASIVIIGLSDARNKAKDARIMMEMWQVRTIAEAIRYEYDSYATTCAGDLNQDAPDPYGEQLGLLEDDIYAQGSLTIRCYASSDDYCVSAELTAAGAGWYCADFTAIATTTDGDTCDSTNYTCAAD